jgi:hypothetical protein
LVPFCYADKIVTVPDNWTGSVSSIQSIIKNGIYDYGPNVTLNYLDSSNGFATNSILSNPTISGLATGTVQTAQKAGNATNGPTGITIGQFS